MRQRRPRTVAHLKTCLQEEWDKITPETLHHLVSSVPKRLLSVVKRNGTLQSGKCFTVPIFWNVLQVWMTGKDVYLQMTWSWPDKTWNILCSYCLQWNTSQSTFRNHYFLFLFAFSILSQLFWFGVVVHLFRSVRRAGFELTLPEWAPRLNASEHLCPPLSHRSDSCYTTYLVFFCRDGLSPVLLVYNVPLTASSSDFLWLKERLLLL